MAFKWGELAGQSNTCTWQFSHHACVDFAEWIFAEWSKILLEDELVISKELIASWHHEIFLGKLDILVNCCINRRLEEAEVTNTSWWHRPPNHNWLWKLHISLEAAICVPFMFRSPFFLHTLGPLFPKEITNLEITNSSENMTEDHCSVVFLLSSFFFLLSAPLQPLLSLSAIEQRFYSWYTAAESLFMFMQPSMCCSVRCLHSTTPVSFHIPASCLELQNRFFLANLANWRSSLSEVDLFRPQFCRLLPIFRKHLQTADWEIPSSAAISTCLMPLTESHFNTATWLSVKSHVLPIF